VRLLCSKCNLAVRDSNGGVIRCFAAVVTTANSLQDAVGDMIVERNERNERNARPRDVCSKHLSEQSSGLNHRVDVLAAVATGSKDRRCVIRITSVSSISIPVLDNPLLSYSLERQVQRFAS